MSKLLNRIFAVIRLSRTGRGPELDAMIKDIEGRSQGLFCNEQWMPPKAWHAAARPIMAGGRDKEWAAISSDPNGLVSLVMLSKPLDGPYEARFYQGHAVDFVDLVKSSTPVAYDPWRDARSAQVLARQGIRVVGFRNSIFNMSEPMIAARHWVNSGLLLHDGHSTFTEHVLNVIDRWRISPSLTHTHYPRRRKRCRIDGACALIMAVGLALDGSRLPEEVCGDD